MIRAVIVAATIAALIALWNDRPKPIKSVQVDYCPITVRGAAKDDMGEWHFGWAQMYGPLLAAGSLRTSIEVS